MINVYTLAIPLLLESIFNTYFMRKYNALKMSTFLPSCFAHLCKITLSMFMSKGTYTSRKSNILILCLIYELQYVLLAKYTPTIPPILFQICWQSRLIFLCFLSITILKKKFKVIQYIGQLIILIGILIVPLSNTSKFEKTKFSFIPCFGVISAGFCSSLGSIVFEKHIRRKITDFYSYLFFYSTISFLLSSAFVTFEFVFKEINVSDNFAEPLLYKLTFMFTLLTMTITFYSTKICPIKRTFLLQLITMLANTILHVYLGEEIKKGTWLSLFLCNLGFLCYEYEKVGQLFGRNVRKVETKDIKTNKQTNCTSLYMYFIH